MSFSDAVPFPFFALRSYRGEADIPALLAVHRACDNADRLDPHSVCYRLPHFSPARYAQAIASAPATILAFVEGQVVAHGFLEVWGDEERCYLWRVWVKPDWRNKGIGTHLLHWGEAEAKRQHGSDPRLALHLANASEGEADAIDLLKNEGYRLRFVSPELAFDDFSLLPAPRTILAITVRSLQIGDENAVARALCEANLDSPGSEDGCHNEPLETRLTSGMGEWLARIAECDPALSFVAWDGEQVVGAYLCHCNDAVGEIAQVAVRARWRGKGIARLLAEQSLHALHASGCVTARLFTSIGADEQEPTQGPYAMYRKFGFYPIARHLRFFKPLA